MCFTEWLGPGKLLVKTGELSSRTLTKTPVLSNMWPSSLGSKSNLQKQTYISPDVTAFLLVLYQGLLCNCLSFDNSETMRREVVLFIGIVFRASRANLVYPAQTASCLKTSLLPGFLRTALHFSKEFWMTLILWPSLALIQRNPLEYYKEISRCHQHCSAKDMFGGTWQAQGGGRGYLKLHLVQNLKDTKGLQVHQSWGQ